MKNRFSFEYKIAGIIIVVISLVTLIGFYAYQRFSNIVSTMGEAVRPDLHLVTAKGLLNDLSDAENNVKTYSLTKDPIYLNKIGEIYEEVQLKLSALNEIQTALDKKIEDIDSLPYFVESKFEILNQLLSLQSGFRVDEALKKVSSKIDEAPTVEDTLLVPLERTKRALLKKNRTEIDTVFAVVNRIDVEDVNRGIKHVGTEEKYINRQLVAQELALIEKDRFISLKIRAVLKNIEVFEKAKIKKETEYATAAVKSTNRQIALFSVTIAILLILLIAIIIKYVRYNNRYRALLKDARLQSESLARAKAKFVATMSHEIRTPMNAVIGFTEQLSKSDLSEAQREQLNIVRKSSDHILSLINEVLDLSKLQQQKITLATQLFQPVKVFDEVIELFSEQAAKTPYNYT
jgi:CHASE3 domain sensor protein